MLVSRKIHTKSLPKTVCLIASILLLKLNFALETKHNAFGGVGKAHFFRFQNFEPRTTKTYANETLATDIPIASGDDFHSLVDRPNDLAAANLERKGRGFHFQATDQDLTVDAEFIIPFVKVPIGWSTKMMKATMRKLLNLHTGALLWSGAFVVVGAIVAGVVNTVIALKPALTQSLYGQRGRQKTRALIDEEESWQVDNSYGGGNSLSFADLLDAKLHEYDIDLKACMQQRICHLVRNAENNIRAGKASGSQKITLGILRAQKLRQFMRGTAVSSAIEAGQNLSCENLDRRCKWTELGKQGFLKFIKKHLKTY